MNEHGIYTGDMISVGVIITTLAGWLPTIAAGLSVVWFLIRIVESDFFAYVTGWNWRASWAKAPPAIKEKKDDPTS